MYLYHSVRTGILISLPLNQTFGMLIFGSYFVWYSIKKIKKKSTPSIQFFSHTFSVLNTGGPVEIRTSGILSARILQSRKSNRMYIRGISLFSCKEPMQTRLSLSRRRERDLPWQKLLKNLFLFIKFVRDVGSWTLLKMHTWIKSNAFYLFPSEWKWHYPIFRFAYTCDEYILSISWKGFSISVFLGIFSRWLRQQRNLTWILGRDKI